MQKFLTILKISVFSVLFMSCSTYYLSSYYEDDGIYVSTDRGTNYEGVFDNYAQVSLDDFTSSDNGNLPWGAKPDSREIVNNFFPSFGRFYYNPFFHDMSFNPFFTNNGLFINYGFSSYPFFYESYRYGLGYPFYPRPIDYYLNPYSYFIGNYYWYYFRNSRMYPWYYGGMYDSRVYERSYANTSDPAIINQTPTISNSASRRGEKTSSSENSRSTNSNGVRVSSIYSRLGSYGGVYIDRTGINNDRMNTTPNLRQLKQNNLIGVYRSGSGYSRSINSTSSIPNLSAIKNDVVRETYQRIRSINPSQRGSTFQGRSFNNDTGRFQASPNYYNSNSRRSGNSSFSSSRSSGGSNFSSGSSSGGTRGSAGGASAGGARGGGGKIQ